MVNGIVISDAGPIFSLAVLKRLNILESLFGEIRIPNAVWEEITLDKTTEYFDQISTFFRNRVVEITGTNHLTFVMDYGESEAMILYQELSADFLLIDDRKARSYAENLEIKCIGTLGILIIAKQRGIIKELKPLFQELLDNKRYYSLKLLNSILFKLNESIIENKT